MPSRFSLGLSKCVLVKGSPCPRSWAASYSRNKTLAAPSRSAPSPSGGRLGWGQRVETGRLMLAPTCSAHIGLQADAVRRARRMRLESPASAPTLQRGREQRRFSPNARPGHGAGMRMSQRRRPHSTTGLSGSSFRLSPSAGKCVTRCCVTACTPLTTPPSKFDCLKAASIWRHTWLHSCAFTLA